MVGGRVLIRDEKKKKNKSYRLSISTYKIITLTVLLFICSQLAIWTTFWQYRNSYTCILNITFYEDKSYDKVNCKLSPHARAHRTITYLYKLAFYMTDMCSKYIVFKNFCYSKTERSWISFLNCELNGELSHWHLYPIFLYI